MAPKPTNKVLPPGDHGKSLLQFLREELQLSNRQAKTLLDRKSVFVNGKRVWMAKHPLKKGDRVEWTAPPSPSSAEPGENTRLEILYRDSALLAVNKPAGMVSDRHQRSVESRLREQVQLPELRALHRLDKDSSGLLMFLYSSEYRERYLDLFRKKEIKKVYRVLLTGNPGKDRITVRKSLDGKSAETEFRILARNREFCMAECLIGTGRYHQIRRHALETGCRVSGDRTYGLHIPLSSIEKSMPRQMLHALSVEFVCPLQQKQITLQAPLPPDFKKALSQCGFKK